MSARKFNQDAIVLADELYNKTCQEIAIDRNVLCIRAATGDGECPIHQLSGANKSSYALLSKRHLPPISPCRLPATIGGDRTSIIRHPLSSGQTTTSILSTYHLFSKHKSSRKKRKTNANIPVVLRLLLPELFLRVRAERCISFWA